MISVRVLFAASTCLTIWSVSATAATVVPIEPFRGVELRGGGHVVLRHGDVQRVTLVTGSTQFTRFHIKDSHVLAIDACSQNCPHRYDLQVEITTPRIDSVAIEGGGKIESDPGFGKEQQLASAVDGGGEIDIRSIPSDAAEAAINGGGIIKLTATGHLEAAVDGGGDIRYWGDPRVTSAVNGGGSVSKGG